MAEDVTGKGISSSVRKKSQLWTGLGTKLWREITLGEQGLLLSLCSFLPPRFLQCLAETRVFSYLPGKELKMKCFSADFLYV